MAIDGGHLGGFATDEGDPGFGAGSAHAADERFYDCGLDLVNTEVVEKGERPGAHDGDVAGDGGDEIAAEVLVRLGGVYAGGDEGLGAATVGALHHDGVGHAADRVSQREQRTEGAKLGEDGGGVRTGNVRFHAPDGLVAGLDIDAGGFVVDGAHAIRVSREGEAGCGPSGRLVHADGGFSGYGAW